MKRSFASCCLPRVVAVAACDTAVVEPLLVEATTPVFSAATNSFTDDFLTWNAGLWTAEEHPLGRGWFRAANVSVDAGRLRITAARPAEPMAVIARESDRMD